MWLYVVLILLTILYIVIKLYRNNLPPGPSGFSVMRDISFSDIKKRLEYFRRLRLKYGDVFSFNLFGSNFVVVNGGEALQEIFIKNGHLTSERPVCFVTIFAEEMGLISSSGHLWKEHRTFALATLRSFGFGKRSLEYQITEQVKEFLSCVEEEQGRAFNISNLLSQSTANVICSLAFGKRFEKGDERIQKFLDLANGEFENPRSRILNYFPFLRHLPGDPAGLESMRKENEAVRQILVDIVEEHRISLDPENARDYIDMYLIKQKQQQGGTTFTDKQLHQSVQDIFLAGTETTSTTIWWAILFLIIHQDIQDKMRAEIDSVISPSQLPSLEHRSRLPFCEAVMTESLRRGNIAPFAFPHDVKENLSYKGYTIKKGTMLMLNIDSVSMDPDVFPDPEKFDPYRFLSKSGEYEGNQKIFPFSLGRRVCLGESLARMEFFLFLVSLVQRFKLLPVDPESLPSTSGVQRIAYSPLPYEMKAVKRL